MDASDRSPTPSLFKRSVLAWRADYLAEKALQQPASEAVQAAELPKAAATLKIIKSRRFTRRK